MAVDFRRPPVDVLHMPTIHHGVSYLGRKPGWIVRPVEAAEFRMFAESESAELRCRQKASIQRLLARLPAGALEIRSSPVLLENARFARGMVQISERFWLNGASGGRVRTKFEVGNPERWRLDRYLGAFRRSRSDGLAETAGPGQDDAANLDVAIELKNGFNYYHFSTETLGSLAHFVEDGSDAAITLHLPKGEIKGFVSRFIAAVFPQLQDRVRFETKPRRYKRVRSVYSHQHYVYAANDALVTQALADPALDPRWSEILRNPLHVKLAAMQSHDSSLRMLRNAGLAQLRAAEPTATPRLIWMGRDESGDARARGISGHQPLLEALSARGFQAVAFEHLSPIEQIAAMNNADVVIAPHGAGLANMIYAKPGARVIEIGTRQTQLHRWGDFLKCAHVSRCRYDTVFADIDGVSHPTEVPPMADGHRGVRIGRRATDRILKIVDESLE